MTFMQLSNDALAVIRVFKLRHAAKKTQLGMMWHFEMITLNN